MDNTNVSSSYATVNFVIYGANEKLNIKQKAENHMENEFKGEIKMYDNTEKDLERPRRTIPMSCEAKIKSMKAHKARKNEANHENR